MNLYIKDFIRDFIKLISSKLFKSTNKEISYVNDIFVNIFESVNYCIINNKIDFILLSDEKFSNFIN